jgi:hypothetical protein
VATLTCRVKLVAERQPGVITEIKVARIERDAGANLAELGLRLEEAHRVLQVRAAILDNRFVSQTIRIAA